jgi:signal transduction histidine kinase
VTNAPSRKRRLRIPARIRDKLAWWVLGTLTLQMVVLALIVLFLMQRSLVSQVDRLLDIDARAITGVLASHEAGAAWSDSLWFGHGWDIGMLTLGAPGSDAQAVLWTQVDGQPPRALTATPGTPELPVPSWFGAQSRTHVTAADGKGYYLRSIDVPGDGGARYLVQAARPATLVWEPLLQLAQMLALGFAVATLLGWFGGQAIARAALAPIKEIVRATRAIRISRLGKRLRESGPEDELLEVTREINDLLQRFQDGLDRERRFASDVSHELRTPLAAQSVIAQATLRNPAASLRDYEAAVRHMLEETRHMEQFIGRLLTLSRLSTSPVAMALEAVDVQDVIETTVATLQVLGEDKGHHLSVECADRLSARGETTMLRQALMNIVHNAIEHCRPGARIVIRAIRQQHHVVVEVDDNGPGVEPQERTRLFTRLHRGAPQGAQRRRGLGLGLSIVKALMEAQGGSVHFKPKQSPGAVFCLKLQAQGHDAPRRPVLDAAELTPPNTHIEPAGLSSAPRSAKSPLASALSADGQRRRSRGESRPHESAYRTS